MRDGRHYASRSRKASLPPIEVQGNADFARTGFHHQIIRKSSDLRSKSKASHTKAVVALARSGAQTTAYDSCTNGATEEAA